MKYDIVVKKRENTLKRLEHTIRICFHLHKQQSPGDLDAKVLKRTLDSIEPSIVADFDVGLHSDFEDPCFLEEQLKNLDHRTVLDLEQKIRRLRFEYIKLRAKEAKLSGPIHLYEYSKQGLWFQIRKVLLWSSVAFMVLLSAVALHAQLAFTLNHFFEFNFFSILHDMLPPFFLGLFKALLLCYTSVAVLYAVCRIEIKHWYLLEKKSSTLSSMLFYIL
jgi:hypothetical protein